MEVFIFGYSLIVMAHWYLMSDRYSTRRCRRIRNSLVAVAALSTGAMLAAGVMSAAAASGSRVADRADSNALMMTAEMALRRDDCGRASADYTEAAQHLADASVAKRAVGVALGLRSVSVGTSRRRRVGGNSHRATRRRCTRWCGRRLVCSRSTRRARHSSAGCRAAMRLPSAVLPRGLHSRCNRLPTRAECPATLAMLTGVRTPPLQSAPGQLALADLALDGWNYREALQYAQRALSAGAASARGSAVCSRGHTRGWATPRRLWPPRRRRARRRPRSRALRTPMCCWLLGREREAQQAIETLAADPALQVAGATAPGPDCLRQR